MIDIRFHNPLNIDGHSVKAEFLNIRKPFFSPVDVSEAIGCFRNQKGSQ